MKRAFNCFCILELWSEVVSKGCQMSLFLSIDWIKLANIDRIFQWSICYSRESYIMFKRSKTEVENQLKPKGNFCPIMTESDRYLT